MGRQRDLARLIKKERETITTQLARIPSPKMNGFLESPDTSDRSPGDLLEQAQQEFLREQEARSYELLSSRAQALDRAWEDLQQGTYGICRLCGKQIPRRRLEAIPTAVFCVSCQEVLE
ncbi:MAG: TraR/DksA family transcriptional regulator [Candidatus Methylomirabilales bacterium]